MLRPLANRWDWYSLPFDQGKPYAQMPGVVYRAGRFEFHRSHLALMREVPGVSEALAPRPTPAPGIPAGIVPRPWQLDAFQWISPRRGVLLTDEMRLGKTLTSLLLHDPASGPLVVLAPLDTRPGWVRWMRALWPGQDIAIAEGRTMDPALLQAPLIFSHYDLLPYMQVTSLRPGTLIVDEIHLLSTPTSKRTRAVQFFASAAGRVIGLSGTPLWNAFRGAWGVLSTCNPGAWGRLWDFGQRYCGAELTEYGWRYDGISERQEWEARRSEVVFGRSWKDVLPDLAPVQRTVTTVLVDPKHRMAIDIHAEDLRDHASTTLDITALSRYRAAIGHFKVDLAVERARAATQLGQPIVLWAWHKGVIRAIAKHLDEPYFTLWGDDPGPKRAATIEAWVAAKTAPLLATMAVGQVGIDLSHADRAVFVETDWTPAVLAQTEMRTFAAGRPTYAEYLALDHEIDQQLMDTIVRKVARGRDTGLAAASAAFDVDVEARDRDELLADLGRMLLGQG